MTESADKPPSGETHLGEESDVIELTEEVAASASTDGDEADDLDAMDLEMPEFKVPGQKTKRSDPPNGEVAPEGLESGEEASSYSEQEPATQRLSQEALNDAAKADSSHDELVAATAEEESSAPDSEDEEPDYDRQSMVKTIQMEAFDRQAVEGMLQSKSGARPELLQDARFSPEIIAAPPAVLVKKWREGLPGGVDLIVGGKKVTTAAPLDRPSSSANKEKEPTEVEEENENVDETQTPVREKANTLPELPAATLEDVEAIDTDTEDLDTGPASIEVDADLLVEDSEPEEFDDDVVELDDDLVELEEDSEPKKTASAPPENPPLPVESKKKPAKIEEPDPVEPAAPRGDSEMKGLVEELLEDEKEQKSKKSTPTRPRDIWFKEVFCEEYLRTVPPNISSLTKEEADFIEASLKLKKNSRILDLACGFGRHSMELAAREFEMVGLDLSMPLLQRALDAAQKRSLNVKFIRGDMRDLNFSGIFDGCFIWDTSLGYFDDRTNLRVLHGVHRALKKGGRLLIDVVNRDYVIRQTPTRLWWEGSGCIFLEESEFDYQTSTLQAQRSYIYEDGSPPLEHTSYVRLYTVHELRQMLHVAGFKVIEVSGARFHRGHFLGAASQRIIMLAVKREKKKSSKSGAKKR